MKPPQSTIAVKLLVAASVVVSVPASAANVDWTGEGRGLEGQQRIIAVGQAAQPSRATAAAVAGSEGSGPARTGADLIGYVAVHARPAGATAELASGSEGNGLGRTGAGLISYIAAHTRPSTAASESAATKQARAAGGNSISAPATQAGGLDVCDAAGNPVGG
ncbi:MAG TPA: hypothetical protein VMT29_11210 [Steroidobacteraceae bacterium]|nr:hypothetical protein [Steroidobacteraceae bacterium]